MRITSTHQHLYIGLEDEYGKVINEQILVVGASGTGKTLFSEGIAEEFHKLGYLVLVLSDPKSENEWAYQMFEPEERYHLDHLRKIGKEPSTKKLKLYHPYTQNLPKNLPDINLFTLSLKNLGRTEWGLIAETDYDKEVVRLLIQASENISKEDGIYGFMHHVQDMVKGKETDGNKRADPKNFFLQASGGTMKSISEISTYMQPFKKDLFLAKDNCSLNLNWKEILSDQEHYHVFLSQFIRDEKLKDFLILSLLEGLLRNKDYAKKPILVVISEIRKIAPFKPEGHKLYLSNSIKNALSLMRSSGRGMSSLLDSQVYTDISADIRNSSTKTFLGQLGGGDDLDKTCKFYSYKREIKEKLKNMPYRNCFLLVGKEDEDVFTGFMSDSMHCEPDYNFIEMYRKKGFSLKNYSEIHKIMKKMLKDEEDRFRDRIKKREKAEKERKEKEKSEKESRKEENQNVEKKIEKAEKKMEVSDLMKGKMIHQIKKENPKLGQRRICERLGIPEGSKGCLAKWEKDYLDNLETIVPGIDNINSNEDDGYSEE